MNALEIFAKVACLVAVTGYVAAGILFIEKRNMLAYIFTAIGWGANLAVFIQNWYINDYPPFASMYQVLSDISLLFVLLMVAIMLWRPDLKWVAPYFCFGAMIPMIGTLFMDRNMHWSLMPALRSPYFVPHVFSYVLSYALCAVAFLVSVIGLIKRREKERFDSATCFILRIAFPFMVCGMLLGALWADQVWGNFWTWDVKEVWSLITVSLYLCYFHARRIPKMKKATDIFSFLGFAALIFTFLCVNVLPNIDGSLHTYT